MSNWWGDADGTKEHAFTGFVVIPDGEISHAQIISVGILPATDNSEECFDIRWKLIEGSYKNREISQKLRVNDQDIIRQKKAKNQLLFFMKMFHVKPSENAPTPMDLQPMIGGVAVVTIGLFVSKEGKEYNFIREVHPSNKPIEDSSIDSALSRNPRVSSIVAEDDLPF